MEPIQTEDSMDGALNSNNKACRAASTPAKHHPGIEPDTRPNKKTPLKAGFFIAGPNRWTRQAWV